MEIHRVQLDGVPAFWAEAAGRFMASLVFRAGRSDETMTTSGVTHLVEHLALPTDYPRSIEFNGAVDTLYTSLWATGPKDRVVEFLQTVTGSLAALPADRLETERRILLTEESGTFTDPVQGALALRFGAQGPGLGGFIEIGLRRLSLDEVAAWAAERFTRGNVAVFATGEPPADVRWELPPGERVAPREPRPIPYLELPAVQTGSVVGMIVVAFVGERSTALRVTLAIAQHRARQRLRHSLGVTYDVSWSYDPLTRDLTHVAIWADCLPENAGEVARELLAVLDELAADGPTPEELERDRDEYRDWLADSESAGSELFYRAGQELLDDEYRTPDELLAEMEALTPSTAAAALAAGLGTTILIVPEGTRLPSRRFTPYPNFSPTRLSGRSLSLRGLKISRDVRRTRLVLADDGLSLVFADGDAVTVRFDKCVAVERWASGARAIWGADGFRLEISPEEWRGGDDVVRTIDERIPPELAVPMDAHVEERVAEVDAVAEARVKRGWMTSDELKTIPGLLLGNERVVTLAQASKGWRRGMLALTDRRLLFLYLEDLVEEVDLAAVSSVDSSPPSWYEGGKLILATESGEMTYTDVARERLDELVSELRRLSDA